MQKNDYCNCPKKKCERHGDCEKCEAYHQGRKLVPYCHRKGLIARIFNK